MSGFWDFVRSQRTFLPLVPTPEKVKGGTYIVSGGNTGLGFECTKHLVELGADRVIIAVRSLQKGNDAVKIIHEATGRQVCEVWELDLASFDSVEKFANKIQTLDRIDALIENAGVAMAEFTLSEGVETSVMVNVAGTMLLAMRAIPKLQESARKFNITPHISIVASEVAFTCEGVIEAIEGDVFEALGKPETTKMNVQYQLTKLLEIYAVRELTTLYPVSKTGVVVNVLNPGLCRTELSRNAPFLMRLQIRLAALLLGRTSEQGSRTLLQAAFAGPESHGRYNADCQIKEQAVPQWILNENGLKAQKRVWTGLMKFLDARGHGVTIGA